jgi:hypothetical protein
MQPQGAQWKPNPQPSRTKVIDDAAGCGRSGEIEEACALIESDDASTPQVTTKDNLLNIDSTPFPQPSWEHCMAFAGNGTTGWRFLSKRSGLVDGVFFADG